MGDNKTEFIIICYYHESICGEPTASISFQLGKPPAIIFWKLIEKNNYTIKRTLYTCEIQNE